MLRRLYHYVFLDDTAFVELLYAFLAFLWGLWVFNPWWDAFERPLYKEFAALADHAWWGIVPMIAGTAWGLCLLLNLCKGEALGRRVLAAGLFVFWMLVSVVFIMGDWNSTATVVYPLIAVGHAWVYWRLGAGHGLR